MKNIRIVGIILISGVLLGVTGCASKAPTIAHAHIGHVVDGWKTTPGQVGLLEAAQVYAQTSVEAATRASKSDASLESIKKDMRVLIDASHPEYSRKEKKPADGKTVDVKLGVRTALLEAAHHIEFSANSADASANVRAESSRFSKNIQAVLDRCHLIAVLGTDALNSTSMTEINLLAVELLDLAQANLVGEDIDGDGIVGAQNPEEYGLKQLRMQIQDMIDREDPAYNTIEQWYLFNLIRLPNGVWIFRQSSSGYGGDSSY